MILVTTKSGRKGKVKITTRVESQISTPTTILEVVDGIEYMNPYNYAQRTRDLSGNVSDAYLKEKIENTQAGTDPMLYPNVDWYGMMFKNQTINTKATVTASGGGEVAQYYLSAAYTHENGLLKVPSVNNYNNNISINRYNIRANIDVNLTKTTKVAVKVYSLLDRSNTPAASTTSLFDQIMRANPVDFPAYYDKSIDNTWYYAEHVLYGKNASRMMKTDVKETDSGYELDVDLPGFKKEEIRLELENGYLTISTEKALENKDEKKGRVLRQERYAGTMSRSFYVGTHVTEEDIKAKYENGVLSLTIPKKEAPKAPEKKTICIEG